MNGEGEHQQTPESDRSNGIENLKDLEEATVDEEYIRAKPPFCIVDGVHNFRDVGGYSCNPSTQSPSDPAGKLTNGHAVSTSTYPASPESSPNPKIPPLNPTQKNPQKAKSVRKYHLYRSAEPSSITPLGKTQLYALGIRKVFDLRSDAELEKYDLKEVEVDGVEFERVGIKEGVWYDPVSLEMRLRGYAEDEVNTFINSYKRIMKDFAPCYEKILRYIIRFPDRGCLVHCTAGKDRTGVFFALLLMLLGVPDSSIISDYALTTIGIKPLMPKLEERWREQSGFRENWTGVLGMCRSRPESMKGALEHVRSEYGSAEGYWLRMTNLTKEDLESVKRALIVDAEEDEGEAESKEEEAGASLVGAGL